MWNRIDDFLFDCIFQPLANRVQRQFDKNNFWMAAQIMMAALAITASLPLLVIGLISNGSIPARETQGAIFLALMLLPLAYPLVTGLRRAWRDGEQSHKFTSAMNPARLVGQHMRLLTTFMTLFGILQAVEHHIAGAGPLEPVYVGEIVMSCLFVIADYFGACTPLPPRMLRSGNRIAATAAT